MKEYRFNFNRLKQDLAMGELYKIMQTILHIELFATKEELCSYLVHDNERVRKAAEKRYDELNGK